MSFHEVQFPQGIAYGAVGGPGFKTSVLTRASGYDDRRSEWDTPRARYDVSHGIKNQLELDELLAFFYARRGRAYGFRFKDWADYKSCPVKRNVSPTDQVIGTGDGVNRQFQLVKVYNDGDQTYVREIKKPVPGTVRVAINGFELTTGWSVDTTTGIVTIHSAPHVDGESLLIDFIGDEYFVLGGDPPAAGTVITAGFEFDVPVRFDTDKCLTTIEHYNVHSWASIPLVEIRV